MTSKQSDLKLTAMPTPNPNSIKFVLEQTFLESGSIDFSTPEKAAGSVLPQRLFDIAGVVGVMIGTNFISITKKEQTGWETVLEPASEVIKELCSRDNIAYFDPALASKAAASSLEETESVKKIKEILDAEIRPAIAMDGGDCEFVGYEDGVVMLRMQGACSNCPSSVMTLKMGIENRLKEDIPEITEVIQV